MTWDGDGDHAEWEEARRQLGPEYWLNLHPKSRCIRCGMPQHLDVDDVGAIARCVNKRCGYIERLT